MLPSSDPVNIYSIEYCNNLLINCIIYSIIQFINNCMYLRPKFIYFVIVFFHMFVIYYFILEFFSFIENGCKQISIGQATNFNQTYKSHLFRHRKTTNLRDQIQLSIYWKTNINIDNIKEN